MSLTTTKKSFVAKAELQDEISNQPLEVKGTIPQWLSGSLLRNGPIQVTVDGESNSHWFDGLAMLHAFSFSSGKVSYSNKFLRTDAYRTVFDEGSLHYVGFAVDPCRSLFKQFLTFFIPSRDKEELHNANINVAKLTDTYVALTEVPLPVKFDPHTLATLGVFDYQDELPKDKCWESAHPHANLTKKNICNYLIQFGRKSTYTFYEIADGTQTRKVIAEVPVDEPAYMHSFSVTDNYLVLTEYPYVVKPLDLMFGSKPFIKNFTWHPERGTRFIVIDRHTGNVVGEYKTKPFFSFHHANAFEKDGRLYVDVVTYSDPSIITDLEVIKDQSISDAVSHPSQLERFTLDKATGALTAEVLVAETVEFPRINDAFDGKPYRYLYLAHFNAEGSSDKPEGLYKVDVESKQLLNWSEEGCAPGEPIFVPAPKTQKEDEGVVLTLIIDKKRGDSFLLVLDGESFKEIGRAHTPHLIPPGLHGQFFL